jgi:transketolase
MRNAFIEELITAAEFNSKIALVVGDLGFGVVEEFAKKFPNQFFNSGVAEQNMMGFAAGLASEGWHVFVYSIANFPTFRCAEQIRNDVDYHHLPVTVVAVGGGLAYGNLGYSHHAIQDYALMRVMPNILIAAPGDPMEVRAVVRYLINHPQPSYLRLGKSGEQLIHNVVPEVSPGKWLEVKLSPESVDAVVSTGAALPIAIANAGATNKSIYSMPMWGMRYKDLQRDYVKRFNSVTTFEDHLKDGGFGSWMLESINPFNDLRQRINVQGLSAGVAGVAARQGALNQLGGLV